MNYVLFLKFVCVGDTRGEDNILGVPFGILKEDVPI